MNDLRGDPNTLNVKPAVRTSRLREDGAPQGPGYFGQLYNEDYPELTSTEIPATVFNVAGQMTMFIPTIVPTLNRQELIHLVDGGAPTFMIVEKAKHHAEQRIRQGRSPFADWSDTPVPLP